MKKPSSLAQQIVQAQRVLDSWSESHKSSLRLEGSDVFLKRFSEQAVDQQFEMKNKKKLTPA
jgi:hypothetical protein